MPKLRQPVEETHMTQHHSTTSVFKRTPPGALIGTDTTPAPEPELDWSQRIPAERYTSPEFMREEWEKVWTRTWQVACRAQDVAEAGDFHTVEFGRESIIVIRGDDDVVRGFYNVCQHRGTRLCMKGQAGNRGEFKCSYHGWRWNTRGELLEVQDPQTFRNGVPANELGLSPVKVDLWGGFVWFNMNADAPPLLEYLEVIPEQVAPYQPERWQIVREFQVEFDCNWKVVADAFCESYHLRVTHPELLGFMEDFHIQLDCYDRHSRFMSPTMTQALRLGDNTHAIHPDIAESLRMVGLDERDFASNPRATRDALIETKRAQQDNFHFPWKTLSDEQLTDVYHYSIFPGTQLQIFAEVTFVFIFRPHPTSPDKCIFEWQQLSYAPDGLTIQRPERLDLTADDPVDLGNEFSNLAYIQDSFNLPLIQQGMHSAGFKGLYLSDQEISIAHYHKVLMEFIEGRRHG
jgi:phenylpropionate dioxygenase-like ring-hydroxylating dioxygenase large terminal subunit